MKRPRFRDDMVMYVSGALGCTETSKEYLAGPDGPRLKKAKCASLDDVVLILQSRWPSADASEARETVARLLAVRHLRRVGRTAERWKVVRPEAPIPPAVVPPTRWRSRHQRVDDGKKVSPGICPICEKYVKYKNRHARTGSAHDGDECNMNRVRSVMEDLFKTAGGDRAIAAIPRSEEPTMTKLFHDDVLDRLAQKKCDEGCRDNLKSAADEVMRTGISNEIIQAMQIAEARGFLHPDLTLTLVQINQALLFFKADEAVVKEKLTALTPRTKNSVPVPPKVIVKMCALRLNKLVNAYKANRKGVEAHNQRRTEAIAAIAANPNLAIAANPNLATANHNYYANMVEETLFPTPDELRNVEAVKAALDVVATHFKAWEVRELRKEFEILLAKPELTDDHISAGWDMVLAGEVMGCLVRLWIGSPMKWTIYCHTHIESGRRYVGMTKKTMLHRWNQHCAQAKRAGGGRWHFPNAIRRHGKDAFSHQILEVCQDLEVANLAEECWIELLETRNPAKGFNLAKGGGSRPHPIGKNPWDRPEYRMKMIGSWKHLQTPEARVLNRASLNTIESKAKRSASSKDVSSRPEVAVKMRNGAIGGVAARRVASAARTHFKCKRHGPVPVSECYRSTSVSSAGLKDGSRRTYGERIRYACKACVKIPDALKVSPEDVAQKNRRYVRVDGTITHKVCRHHGNVPIDGCFVSAYASGSPRIHCKLCIKIGKQKHAQPK